MRYLKLLNVVVACAMGAQIAGAAPTAEEAAQLGGKLTPLGAIKAGNKEGTIPEYSGGLCTPPAGYNPARGLAAGGAPYINPFAGEKPQLKITADNLAQYADKVDEGTKELFRRFPKTYYLSVYPTHRTACFQSYVNENTVKKVMNPKIVVTDGVPALTGAHAQIPFPIPKDGVEAMWNTLVKPEPPYIQMDMLNYVVDSSGKLQDTSQQTIYNQNLYWDNTLTAVPEDQPYWSLISKAIAPASQVGTMQMRTQYLRPDLHGSPAWSYIPGQRRVRLAPEFSYDGVATQASGLMLYDEINGFDGKMDRFDFKLVGRKEMFVPYNVYDYIQGPKSMHLPNHVDPEVLRWELHRVWMVEATLKPGERHVQKRKVFYIDEDSWNTMIYTGFDHANKPHHLYQLNSIQEYEHKSLRNSNFLIYDFSKGMYMTATKWMGEGILNNGANLYGTIKVKPYPANHFTPDALAGRGLR